MAARRPSIRIWLAFCAVAASISGSWAEELISDPNNGPTGNRVDIVFLGDGYQSHELDTYDEHIDGMLAHMFNQEPFNRYRNFFNIHRIDVISNESGADVSPENISVDTALNSRYYFDGQTERLLYLDEFKANLILINSIPLDENIFTPDMQFVSVNATRYGGAGGTFATFAGANSEAYEIAVHEIAHSFSNLADEYFFPNSPYTQLEPAQPNVTKSPTGDKWSHWIGHQQPGIGLIDVYEGGLFSDTGIYRPSNNSKMRQLGRPFDAVSREALVLSMYEHLDPLDSFSAPDAAPWVKSVDPNVIDLTWSINGTTVDGFDGEQFDLGKITEAGLLPGHYDIAVHAADNTEWVRIRTDELEQTVSWSNVAYFPGDFDDNEVLDFLDIDSLTSAVRASSEDLTFDVNLDGQVDELDRTRWIEVNQTFFGDADLNGAVDFADFLALSQNFGTDNAGWVDGNFTSDSTVNFNDFLVLSLNFGNSRTSSSNTAIEAAGVPEPASRTLLLLAAIFLGRARKRRTVHAASHSA